jgi:hypothetical protein
MFPKIIQRLAPGGVAPAYLPSEFMSYISGPTAAMASGARQVAYSTERAIKTRSRALWPILGLLLLALVGFWIWKSRPAPQSSAQTSSPTQPTASTTPGVDNDIQLLRQDIRSQAKQLVAANLILTDTEATKFWPVYDRYTTDMVKINDQRYSLLKEYADRWGTMTDDQASSLTQRFLSVDEQAAQLRSKYLPIFNQAVPGIKAASFFQLDHRIQDLIDLQVASQLPLAQEQ